MTPYDLLSYLHDNGVLHASEMDCDLILKFFDSDDDGRLNYNDYMQVVLPCESEYLRAAVTQRKPYDVESYEYLPGPVELELSRLLEKEVNYHRDVEMLKRDLEASYDFSSLAAFNAIDDWNYKYIDQQALNRFLRRNGYKPKGKTLN